MSASSSGGPSGPPAGGAADPIDLIGDGSNIAPSEAELRDNFAAIQETDGQFPRLAAALQEADRLPVDTSQPVPEWIQLVPPFEYGIDPNDGFHYTLLEFRQHYGDYDGLRELWEMFAILATLAID